MHLFALAGVGLMTVTANHCRLDVAGGDCGLGLLEHWDHISSPGQGMMLHIHKPVEERELPVECVSAIGANLVIVIIF